MAYLKDIITFLDRELKHDKIKDYPGALNGLQLDNSGIVQRVIAAVDSTLPVIEKAAELGSGSLLVVHHGMFWNGPKPFTGALHRKLKLAMETDMAIYSSHLPLDVHPQWGNNSLLASKLGIENTEPFLNFNGLDVGLRGHWSGTPEKLKADLELILEGPVHVCDAGPEAIERIGIVTGGAGNEIAQAAAVGVDAFVTGEGPHWSYGSAEELGIHLFYGGHYATETFGVKALGRILEDEFCTPWSFIDHATGL